MFVKNLTKATRRGAVSGGAGHSGILDAEDPLCRAWAAMPKIGPPPLDKTIDTPLEIPSATEA